jgi:hypothetical protein
MVREARWFSLALIKGFVVGQTNPETTAMKNIPIPRNNSSSSYALNLILGLALVLFAFPGHATKAASMQDQPEAITAADKVVKAAKQLIVGADETRLKLASQTAELKKQSAGEQLSQASLSNISSLTRIVNRIDDTGLPKELEQAQKNLADIKPKLEKARTDLVAVTPQTAETAKAIERVKSVLTDVDETKAKLTEANGELASALVSVYEYVRGLATRTNDDLASLKKTTLPAEDLLLLLPRDLSKLVTVLQSIDELKAGWKTLSDALSNVFGEHQTNAKKTGDALTALDETVAAIVVSMDARMKLLADYAKRKSGNIAILIGQLKQNPGAVAKDVQESMKEASLIVEGLDRISTAWDILATPLANAEVAGVDAAKIEATRKARDEMFGAARELSQSASTLQASLGGDFSQFVTEKVRLYYFTDVPRLIKTLNDAAFIKGGDPAAQARASEEFQKLLAVETDLREAEAEAAKFKARQLALQRQLDDARADLNAASILSRVTTSRLEELKRRPAGDVPAERMARAEEEKKRRDDETNKAQQRFDELNDEQSGLPAKIREARERRDEAQTEMERLNGRLSVTAQTESSAFARARDNAPFWFAAPIASHPDPLKRVELSSSTGGDNTITIRGLKADVAKVKEYIAVLDEPAPQARMTLWKLELSSDASNDGTKKFNEALMIVESTLANTRAKIAGSLSLLLDTINEEANREAESMRSLDPRDARYSIYAPQVLKELHIESLVGPLNPKSLGLKDPAKATTLNEALLVLLLSKRGARQNILLNFERRMTDRLREVTIVSEKEKPETFVPKGTFWFNRLHSMIGDDLEHRKPSPNRASPPDAEIELTRSQGELVYALRGKVLQKILPNLAELNERIKEYRFWRKEEIRLSTDSKAASKARARADNLEDTLLIVLGIFYDECGIKPQDMLDGKYEKIEFDGNSINFVQEDGRITPCRVKSTNARVAAADGLLDGFTKAFEDDLDREFVQPMLERLRAKLRSKGIGVGVIQRTSVLATNRLVARVDPRATAELALGEETNILQAVQQLAQLTLAAQTGGGLGVLGAFQSQAGDESPPEVFGLTTGNTFQVTPIFDPTGQALRFRFDFVGMTRIREPNDSTNPRLPRIERHTVNTEVQLSNLEIREVSRFESNARLGQPTRVWGGIPILKDIPGLRIVPVIGWFVRKTGKAAVTQQSLIFAQTTMSPTIGDILDLSDDSRIQP